MRGDQLGWPGCAANTQTPQAGDGRIGHAGMITTRTEGGAIDLKASRRPSPGRSSRTLR